MTWTKLTDKWPPFGVHVIMLIDEHDFISASSGTCVGTCDKDKKLILDNGKGAEHMVTYWMTFDLPEGFE